jgi:hypothetical protein
MGATMLGRMCRMRILISREPSARAARTYSFPLTERTEPLTRRTKVGAVSSGT